MALYDKNGDGSISYDEFLEYITTRSATKSFKQKIISEKVQKNRDAVALRKIAERKQNLSSKSDSNNYNDIEDDESEDIITEPDNYSIVSGDSSNISSNTTSSNIADIFRRPSTASTTTSMLSELLDSNSLESRTKILFECLRNLLTEKALMIRKSNPLKDKLALPLNEYLQKEGRNILSKAFQQYTGDHDGRVSDRTAGIEFNDFARVLRSFKIPGIPSIRQEVIEYIFTLCQPINNYPSNNSYNPLTNRPNVVNSLDQPADSSIFIDLVFGLSNKSTSYINQLNKGRELVSTGPFPQSNPKISQVDHSNVIESTNTSVALRFVNHKTRSALRPPASYSSEWVNKSSKLPDYELKREHVFGMSSSIQSGQSFQIIPVKLNNKTNINDVTIVYSTASLGVIHNLQSNQQTFFDKHSNDITAIAISIDGQLAATGCTDKFPTIYIWSTSEQTNLPNKVLSTKVPPNTQSAAAEKSAGRLTNSVVDQGLSQSSSHRLIREIGKGFFERAVNAISFSFDNKYISGISSDDYHMMGIFDVSSGELVVKVGTQHGIPPQLKALIWCPIQQYTEYITRNHKGLSDVLCTVGERHIRLWSFMRPGSNENVSIDYKAPVTTKIKASAPKIYTCAVFIRCEDNTFDLASGGSNGLVYLYRKGEAVASCKAISGGVTCVSYQLDKLFCGGNGGIVKVLDPRTLTIFQSINLSNVLDSPSSRPASRPGSRQTIDRDDRSVSSRRSSLTSTASVKSLASSRPISRSSSVRSVSRPNSKIPTNSPVVSQSVSVTGLSIVSLPSNRSNSQIPGYLYATLTSGVAIKINLSTYDPSTSPDISILFHYHTGPVYAVAIANELDKINKKQRVIATTGDDKWLCIWDAKHRVLLSKVVIEACGRCICFDQTNTYLAIGTTNGLSLYSLTENPTTYPLTLVLSSYRKDSNEELSDVKFSPNNSFIASGSHSSYITHLDWSVDSTLLRSTCGAYELLLWDITSGRLNGVSNISDIKWKSNHCIFDFNLMGIWPPFADGTDINALDVSIDKTMNRELVVTADDSGYVNIMNYPCIVQYAPRKMYSGHSSHVLSIRLYNPSRETLNAVSVGGNDCAVMLWQIISTIPNNMIIDRNTGKYKQKSINRSDYDNSLY
eukprot:gene20489-26582_t